MRAAFLQSSPRTRYGMQTSLDARGFGVFGRFELRHFDSLAILLVAQAFGS